MVCRIAQLVERIVIAIIGMKGFRIDEDAGSNRAVATELVFYLHNSFVCREDILGFGFNLIVKLL